MRNFIVGLLIFLLGGFIGWTAGSQNSLLNNSNIRVGIGGGPGQTTTLSTADLKVNLNRLLMEHGVLEVEHLKSLYDGKDTEPTQLLLDQNGNNISTIFSQIFGSSQSENLNNLWKNHITEYVNYTQALKANDQTKMEQSKQNLTNMSKQFGQLINQLSPNTNPSQPESLMNNHVNLTLRIIDAYSQKDQPSLINQQTEALKQSEEFADSLSQIIITTRPDNFK